MSPLALTQPRLRTTVVDYGPIYKLKCIHKSRSASAAVEDARWSARIVRIDVAGMQLGAARAARTHTSACARTQRVGVPMPRFAPNIEWADAGDADDDAVEPALCTDVTPESTRQSTA